MESNSATAARTRDERCDPAAPPLRTALILGLAFSSGLALTIAVSRHRGDGWTGRIAARTTYVTAHQSGIVIDHLVEEGDSVVSGQSLLTLADEQLKLQIERKQEQIAALETQLSQAQAHAEVELAWRMKEIDADIVETQLRSADYLKERFDHELEQSMWSDALSGFETVLFDQGDSAFKSLVAGARIPNSQRMHAMLRMELASNAIDVSAAQVEICDEQLRRLEELKQRLPAYVSEQAGVDVAEKNLSRARAELARLESRQTSLTIASTAIGQVGVFQTRPGDHVRPGDPIVELLDPARRWLIVDVPSSRITEFTPDRAVELVFPGDEERTGRVHSIAPQAFTCRDGSEATVSVRVEQSGKVWPDLPIGSHVAVRLAD
ncbi:MAG: HlyD family efflux transporter periplasmic adaptor subunit [Planctomycetota bacterium]|nr:MAG: HlyD family efflux transporter periplasmic adaptor subunit [Planctomycetota bacterium]REJ90740.1 MAG: HlyD family efflux transporter periplasmic adaptor subunit [Planctomycetota bacterium]REK26714.1 MAG: HlyD family efflux transporter periplasmic adaptor subunit [Planctomycetota bacterium]REK35625.1 MAG: HlyD family efflux transporter periplasmic adaptor subunit [Planctomycetota bacterium]